MHKKHTVKESSVPRRKNSSWDGMTQDRFLLNEKPQKDDKVYHAEKFQRESVRGEKKIGSVKVTLILAYRANK
jgi:hypothetical protein